MGYYSWTFGQAARDPYYIMVVIYIFFPYFSNTVVGDPVQGQTLIGYLNAAGGFILALTAPFLRAIADKNGRRKPWVAATVMIMSLGASCLWLILPGGEGLGVWPALALLLVISVAFATSEVFHNAMLPSVAPLDKVGTISGIAFAAGNVGGLLLMLFVLFAFSMPGTVEWSFLPGEPLFGIDQDVHEHDRIVGPIAGVWMFLFTLPVLMFTPDGTASGTPIVAAARQGVRDVLDTLRQLPHYANIAIYLLSRMFFIDGMVGVMTFGGVYASGTFNWDTTTLLIFGLCTSGSAMFGAWIGGLIDDRFGSITTLKIAIGVSSLVLITLVSIQPDSVLFVVPVGSHSVWSFPYFTTAAEIVYFGTNQVFAMFFVTGLSSSRTLMARIAPPEMATQFFGLFALSGTVTAFLAPLMVATATGWFQSQRIGFASLAVLMVLGAALLFMVREEPATVASIQPAS
ncbi:MAG: MFS transporter [Pseudomonadales bacterium]|nr:MFS transporter [Pseudomonadales bacterium]MDP6471114.1 MFS transporter [Pseudomonadales bacterium]MDP6825700.1 MFS transporter [Pseudomonadales bacterium]MDP6973156.1 MFS transporter [Pseudomonadales bacterium]